MNLAYEDAKYAAGFHAGETTAFRDRRSGKTRIRPRVIRDAYERAFWDGYTPRSSSWARKVGPQWWTDNENTADEGRAMFDAIERFCA